MLQIQPCGHQQEQGGAEDGEEHHKVGSDTADDILLQMAAIHGNGHDPVGVEQFFDGARKGLNHEHDPRNFNPPTGRSGATTDDNQ